MEYTKDAKSTEKHISLLTERGLIIEDEKLATDKISFIGYYHLSSYFKSFQNLENNLFNDGTTFEDILDLYVFDRKIKALSFDVIERVELSLKTLISDILSAEYGNDWIENRVLFIDNWDHQGFLNKITKKINYLKQKEGVIKEFYEKYDDSFPPAWILMEGLYFSEAIEVFRKLKRGNAQKIAKKYGLDEKVLQTWFLLLNDVRNICAHHGRLWNKSLKKIDIPKNIKNFPKNGNLFRLFSVFAYFLSILSPRSKIIENFISLVENSNIPKDELKFYGDWQNILRALQNKTI